MTDIASLSLEVKSDSVKQANVELRAMAPAASAAERAAQKWGMTTDAATKSSENFSRRVQVTVRNLEFERQQLTRNAAEQEKYAALRRAGVTAASAEGRAIMASVTALQAQRAAAKSAAEATTLTGAASNVATSAYTGMARQLRTLVAAYIGVEAARKLWAMGLSAGDLGEQAEQLGVNTDQLQAYRLAGAQAGIETEQMDQAIMKLARSMGEANAGNKEMIELFQKLGVNILDANGQLRPTADALPEVAAGLLKVGSSTQRTADEMTLFGRAGAKMATVLGDIAGGNDALIKRARDLNAIISPAAIEKWDKLGDSMKVVEQQWTKLVAEFGADVALPALDYLKGLLEGTRKELEGIKSIWQWVMSNMDAAKRADIRGGQAPEAADVQNLKDRLAALRQNPSQFGFQASEKALESQLAAAEARAKASQALVNQSLFQFDESAARRDKLPASVPPLGVQETGTKGAGNPASKGAVEGYQKIIAQAQQYIAMKKVETDAVGMSVEAAARLTHEQELLGKATTDNIALGPAQIAQIKGLAAAMAEADAQFAAAKFMDDAVTKSKEFIASQEIERATLYMSTEAAMAYRLEQEAINRAKAEGIALGPQQIDQLRQIAAEQAAAAEKTRKAKEWVDFERETFKGFFADFNHGLREGATVWEAFGKAGENALGKISDKLLEMAANKVFEAAFGGAGSGGGIWGSIIGWVGSIAGAIAGGGGGEGISPNAANGAVISQGNVVPFARGGIVDRPTLFPMARGAGLMGEAGPEAIMPLRRGRDGRLGVSSGGRNADRPIIIEITGDTDLVHVAANDAAVRVVKREAPSIEGRAVQRAGRQVVPITNKDRAEGHGDWRLM